MTHRDPGATHREKRDRRLDMATLEPIASEHDPHVCSARHDTKERWRMTEATERAVSPEAALGREEGRKLPASRDASRVHER